MITTKESIVKDNSAAQKCIDVLKSLSINQVGWKSIVINNPNAKLMIAAFGRM